MKASILITAFLTTLTTAAPTGSLTGPALVPRQSSSGNAGSVSMSNSNNSGSLLGGLTSSGAAASGTEPLQAPQARARALAVLGTCSSGSSAAGPADSSSSSNWAGLLSGLGNALGGGKKGKRAAMTLRA